LVIRNISDASEATEELAHLEMVSAILHQLTRNLSEEEIAGSPFATYFVDHTTGIYPIAASGVPMDMKYVGIKGDVIADLHEDLAAEQKARVTYDNILRLCDDPDVRDPIKFLREREIVHYQRFGDGILTVSKQRQPSMSSPVQEVLIEDCGWDHLSLLT
jgi:spore coat protein JC